MANFVSGIPNCGGQEAFVTGAGASTPKAAVVRSMGGDGGGASCQEVNVMSCEGGQGGRRGGGRELDGEEVARPTTIRKGALQLDRKLENEEGRAK
eukprot:759622-Hanusia_phi.AAC.5